MLRTCRWESDGMIFLLQIFPGNLQEFYLLHHYFPLLQWKQDKFWELFPQSSECSQVLFFPFGVIPDTLAAFGLKHFLDGFGCRHVSRCIEYPEVCPLCGPLSSRPSPSVPELQVSKILRNRKSHIPLALPVSPAGTNRSWYISELLCISVTRRSINKIHHKYCKYRHLFYILW